jgi:hypothetical protein
MGKSYMSRPLPLPPPLFFGGGGGIYSLHWATQNSFHVNSLLRDTDGSPCQYCAATFVGCVYTVKDMYWIPTKYTCQAIYMYTLLRYIRLFMTCFSSNWAIWCTEYYTKLLAAFWIWVVENDHNSKDKHGYFHKEIAQTLKYILPCQCSMYNFYWIVGIKI